MSLMLRKQCQPVLDANSLANYHVGISANKRLIVVEECGKPLLALSGVVFSNKTPTNKEIIYAVELLGDFIATHKLKIDLYIKELAIFKKEVVPNLNVVNITNVGATAIYKEELYYFYLSKNTGAVEKVELRHSRGNVLSLVNFKKHAVDYKKLEAAIKVYKKYLLYSKKRTNIQELHSSLSLCDI